MNRKKALDSSQNTTSDKISFFKKIKQTISKEIPKEYAPQFKDVLLEANLGRARALSIYIIFIQIALNILNILLPNESESENIMIYIYLSLITLFLGIVYFVLLSLVKNNKIKSRKAKVFLSQSILYAYLIIQLIFTTLNIYSLGDFYSYIIALLIIGLFPILPPRQSIISITAMFAYVFLVVYTLRDNLHIWSAVFATDVWTNLIIVSVMIMIISIFIYNLYVSNFLQKMELQNANKSLESTVQERTKKLEEQTIAAQAASQAKSDFLARMSHEIRTPLNAIIGMTHIAKRNRSAGETQNAVEQIEVASSHLLDLVNDVLDMSKIEAGQLKLLTESFSLQAVINEISMAISPRCAARGINFSSDISSISNAAILGDKMRLKQVLFNLLDNAVKFTPEDGEISLTVTKLNENDDHELLRFAVQDSGIGIREKKIDSLFNAFEQAENTISANYGGTGLGLAISQNLIAQMGGEIKVESTVGKGSCFFFDLNFQKGDSLDAGDNSNSLESLNLQDNTILIVEDIEINRFIVSELLIDTNVKIEEAIDGLEAVEKFKSSPVGYYDLIFMDIQMPNMNGYEATEKIRGLSRNDAKTVPIVAMTANAYTEDIEKAKAAGMNAHLSKPIKINKLAQTLTSFLMKK